MIRYGIAEWFGEPFAGMPPARRQTLAAVVLDNAPAPFCPFQKGSVRCSKRGGVCSFRRYENGGGGRILRPAGSPVILCPKRFEQDDVLPR